MTGNVHLLRIRTAPGITFRRDQTGRPRITKSGSPPGREQKASKEFSYYTADEKKP